MLITSKKNHEIQKFKVWASRLELYLSFNKENSKKSLKGKKRWFGKKIFKMQLFHAFLDPAFLNE